MSDPVIFKNASMILRYHPETGIVHHEMLKRPTSAEFRATLNAGHDALVKNRATKWLSDDRANSVLDDADQTWAQTEWFARMQKAGWAYWAIVNPAKAVGQMQMKRNVATMKMGGVEAAIFATPEEAMAWLQSCGVRKAG